MTQSVQQEPPRDLRAFTGVCVILGCLALTAAWFWFSYIAPRGPNISIGQDAYIQSTGTGVLAAPIEADLESAFHANDVKDQIGLNALGQSGRVFIVPTKTRVHVLSAAVGRWQVRVLEGAHTGQAVWINWDALAP